MRHLFTLAFLVLGGLAIAALDQAFTIRKSIAKLLGQQLRSPDIASLTHLHEAHDQIFALLAGVILVGLCMLGWFMLRLLHTDSLARTRLAEALEARAAVDAAWAQLDEAIEGLSEGFVLYDKDDRLVRANSKYKEIYNISAQWIVPGATFEEIIRCGAYAGQYEGALTDPEGWVRERLNRRKAVRERAILPFEQQLADGRWLIISDRAISTGGMVGIRADITEIKQSMAELERAREDLRLESARARELAEANHQAHKLLDDAIAAISEGFALWDAEDRLITCNARYKAFCQTAGQLLQPGVHYSTYIRAAIKERRPETKWDLDATVAARVHRRRSQGAAEGYIEHIGQDCWVKVNNRPVDGGGVVTVFSDISELKLREIELTKAHQDLAAQAENMRQLKEMAEAANRAKSGFLAMISHEIRTPMNAVLGLSGLLAETGLEDEQRRFVEGIEESGAHLVKLINDLLDFTRLEAEKTALDLAPVSLREVVGGAARMMEILARKKGLHLNVEIESGLPDAVALDAARFSQVLINLLSNAIKFTDQGSVTLAVGGRVRDDNLSLRISVSDTGNGVPEDVRQRLFTPFERAQAHERKQVSGTGLGLAICARLLVLMGGTISLREGGPGAIFDVLLETPLASDEAVPAPAPVLEAAPVLIGTMRVLVAEDTPASQLVIRTLLERRGHRVTLVDNGADALKEAAQGGFDLVLLDIQMPRMSGFETVRAIRSLPDPLDLVPVVALSALVSQADRQASLDAGFDEHIGKPLRVQELDGLISRLAQGAFERTPALVVEGPGEHPALEPGDAGDAVGIQQALDDLATLCDAAVLGELLDLALMNIENEQEALAVAGLEADYDRMRKAAHKLAGVLAQYGARETAHLASLFERGEEALMREGLETLARRIEGAHGHLKAARGALVA